jgi:hypothetical protein
VGELWTTGAVAQRAMDENKIEQYESNVVDIGPQRRSTTIVFNNEGLSRTPTMKPTKLLPGSSLTRAT